MLGLGVEGGGEAGVSVGVTLVAGHANWKRSDAALVKAISLVLQLVLSRGIEMI